MLLIESDIALIEISFDVIPLLRELSDSGNSLYPSKLVSPVLTELLSLDNYFSLLFRI